MALTPQTGLWVPGSTHRCPVCLNHSQLTGAEECETEYEPVEAGLRDEGGSPTFSVRQQELGGKANLDGWRIPTARDNHSRTGWA